MPADTATKRYSALHITAPWRSSLPIPDGTISQGDRQVVMHLYSGILAQAPIAATPYPSLFLVLGTGAD
jgi:hypothetical protein